MTYAEAARLQVGDRVEVDYMGQTHEATIVRTIHSDRWGKTVVVQFDWDAFWAPHYEKLRPIATSEQHA